MKITFLILVLIPFISFGQLSKKNKKKMDKYLLNMCECTNDLLSDTHPKVIDAIEIMADNEGEEIDAKMKTLVGSMSPEELEKFLAAFKKMQDADFGLKIKECTNTDKLDEKFKNQIDNGEGDAHNYMMNYLDEEDACKTMKTLYDLGKKSKS